MPSASIIEIREPNEFDWQTVREFFYARSFIERGKLIFAEMRWVLEGRKDEGQHLKTLPDYCYNILDALRITYFKNFPALTDIIFIKNQAGLAEAKTIEATKKMIQIDWKNLGRMIGVGLRCLRFAEKEVEMGVDGERLEDLPPEKIQQIFTFIFGKQWVEENAAEFSSECPDKVMAQMLNEFIRPWTETLTPAVTTWSNIAFQWSPEAQGRFYKGISEGLGGFLDADSQFVGESNRSNTYFFLLLAWPEIKAMSEARPRKNLSDLRAWLLPFMRVGVMPYLDIDQFRDVCASPAQNGIGLSLRPQKSPQASA